MPKIKAASVAEHRENQRNALIKAAKTLIEQKGPNELTFGELADYAKLARPSVYEYFKNKSELLMAIVETEFPIWIQLVQTEMDKKSKPKEKIEIFFSTQIDLFKKGKHNIAFLVMQHPFEAKDLGRIHKLHEELLLLLASPLKLEGHKDIDQILLLMSGVLHTTLQMIQKGGVSSQKLSSMATSFALGGLKSILEMKS